MTVQHITTYVFRPLRDVHDQWPAITISDIDNRSIDQKLHNIPIERTPSVRVSHKVYGMRQSQYVCPAMLHVPTHII